MRKHWLSERFTILKRVESELCFLLNIHHPNLFVSPILLAWFLQHLYIHHA
ncbi:hypothetical protein Hanom_Chr02g00117011 [Helianthus anomalus]